MSAEGIANYELVKVKLKGTNVCYCCAFCLVNV